jgi:hypothetical protein
MDAVGEGFTTTNSNEEASKLVEDSAVMMEHIIEILPMDMS